MNNTGEKSEYSNNINKLQWVFYKHANKLKP